MTRCLAPALGLVLATGCGEQGQPAPAARPGIVLELNGGVIVADADVEPLVAYLDTTGERLGFSYRALAVLHDHAIPLALARAEFAAERAVLRQRAEAFWRSVDAAGGTILQLRERGAIAGGEPSPHPVNRAQMELAQAAFCFAVDDQGNPANWGRISPVIEVPQGFCVIAFDEYHPGVTRAGDLVEAYLVTFYTHPGVREFDDWYRSQRERVRGTVSYVAPRYRDAIPDWLK